MRIAIITTQLGGTGGAINCIAICNRFISAGHEVIVFSEQMPDSDIGGMLKVDVRSIKEVPVKIEADAGIAFNLTEGTKKALYSVGGRKFARLGIIVPEYQDIMRENDIFKITTTSYEKRYVDVYGRSFSILALNFSSLFALTISLSIKNGNLFASFCNL